MRPLPLLDGSDRSSSSSSANAGSVVPRPVPISVIVQVNVNITIQIRTFRIDRNGARCIVSATCGITVTTLTNNSYYFKGWAASVVQCFTDTEPLTEEGGSHVLVDRTPRAALLPPLPLSDLRSFLPPLPPSPLLKLRADGTTWNESSPPVVYPLVPSVSADESESPESMSMRDSIMYLCA